MTATLDLDQLKTFVAIAETGSFTRAAEAVFKTQSAVSMQMRRLEERIGKPIFARDGRASRLTEDGERLLSYARRMVRLSEETIAAFDETELSGSVNLGTPDDYADRFLPEILARFARSNPRVEVSVICEQSTEPSRTGAHRRHRPGDRHQLRRGPGRGHPPGAAALGRFQPPQRGGGGGAAARPLEGAVHVAHVRASMRCRASDESIRVLYTSGNSTAISAAVLAGLAVTVVAESALRPGMRVLNEAEGFPRLPTCEIGIVRSWHRPNSAVVDKLAEHIVSSLDNLGMSARAA